MKYGISFILYVESEDVAKALVEAMLSTSTADVTIQYSPLFLLKDSSDEQPVLET